MTELTNRGSRARPLPAAASRRRGWLGALLVLLLAPAVGSGQDAALPSGREIIARHVEAIGGEQAYRSVQSVLARGRWEIPAQRIIGTLELQSARPNKMLHRVTVPGIGRIENGYDGRVGWTLSPISGPELLTGRQLTELADEAWFDSTLHLPQHVRDITTMGVAAFDDRQAYRVRVVFTSGNEQVEYFDVATGLHIGTESVRATPQGNVPTVNILRDYRQFGPVLQPTTVVQRALGFEQIVTITSCEYDTVPSDAFALPAEIKALID
jgi:hypothetical protein